MKRHWQVMLSCFWAELLTIAVFPGPGILALVFCILLAVCIDGIIWDAR